MSSKKVVGFTCGAFDILHAGHAMMLKEAKESCDYLIVGVQGDPSIDRPGKNSPVQTYTERQTMVSAIKWVDEIVLYNTEAELLELLKKLQPDVRIIGADWKGKPYTGYNLPMKVVFNSRDHGYSTSELRQRIMTAELNKTIQTHLMPHGGEYVKAAIDSLINKK